MIRLCETTICSSIALSSHRPMPYRKIRACLMPTVPCRISPPRNFLLSSMFRPETSCCIFGNSSFNRSIVSGVRYSSASNLNTHFAAIGKLSNAQLNCLAYSPGHSCSTVLTQRRRDAETSSTIPCVPSVEKQSTTNDCFGSRGESLSRQRAMCSFSFLVRIITATSVISIQRNITHPRTKPPIGRIIHAL